MKTGKRVVVDAMGGDLAPSAPVAGAVQALAETDAEIVLVGPEETVRRELGAAGAPADALGTRLSIVNATEAISNEEAPVMAIRRKKDSTMVVGLRLVAEGKADAFVSAGSTGALLAGALFIVGRLPGVDRPALATVIPTASGRGSLLLDMGANTDPKPGNLVQFAIMGRAYAQGVMGVADPRIGLVNIGVEEHKGNELAKAAYAALRQTDLNFVGNLEARDVAKGDVDVIVTDGFTGNVILKHTEGLAAALLGMIKEELTRGLVTKIGAALAMPAFRRLKRRLDYAEYGGAPFLGVNGAVFKCHGSSDARAIKNGIKVALNFIDHDVLGKTTEALHRHRGSDSGAVEERHGERHV